MKEEQETKRIGLSRREKTSRTSTRDCRWKSLNSLATRPITVKQVSVCGSLASSETCSTTVYFAKNPFADKIEKWSLVCEWYGLSYDRY